MSLSSLLKDLRVQSGQSLQQVAEKVGSSKAYLSELERGVAKNPGIDVLKALVETIPIEAATVMVPPDRDSVPIHAEFRALLPAGMELRRERPKR